MRSGFVVALTLAVFVFTQSVGDALVEFANAGCWPKSWPAELEEFRSQSRTFYHERATTHEIPFADRAKFEAAWPHIVSLASKGAPVTLVQRKGVGGKAAAPAGVRITMPTTGQVIVPGERETRIFDASIPSRVRAKALSGLSGAYLTVGPPWPDAIENAKGDLPEFVVADDLKWRATTVKELRENRSPQQIVRRSRTEITLIVDGEVVDLNRISVPAFVVDRRFEKQVGK